jgi:protein-tyrosine phosphatase
MRSVPQVGDELRSVVMHDGRVGRHRRGEAEDVFRLLFVCTGNICRSPFAEILTRHLLRGHLGGLAAQRFEVSSAGVRAVVGSAMHPESRAELAPWNLHGAHAERSIARQLRSAMIERSHLVLGATSRHRSAVVERCPAALPITFSVREFARLAAAVDPVELPAHPVARAHALVEAARQRRGLVPPDADGNEIPDPMGQPRAAHHEAAMLTCAAVTAIVGVVAPRGPI